MKNETKLTPESLEKGLELIIKASRQRREEIKMSDERNLDESLFALDYLINPPEKIKRES